MLTAEEARRLFRVDQGVLINRVTRGSSVAGSVAGCLNSWGYLQVCTKGKTYKAHRLVWLIEKGVWPDELDHINGLRTDNRIENLREVTRKENLRNQKTRCTNSSGVMGVGKEGGRWRARIRIDGRSIHLGYFERLEDAAKARKDADEKYGYHQNHGRAAA